MFLSINQRIRCILTAYYRHSFLNSFTYRYCSFINVDDRKLLAAYNELGLDISSTDDEVKKRFIDLAKQFHPDTADESVDPNRFIQIRNAFKVIIDYQRNREEFNNDELTSLMQSFDDIQHRAPQHRQVTIEF